MATLATAVVSAVSKAGIANMLMAGGTAVSALGAIQQGKASNAAAGFNARQLEEQGRAERAVAAKEAQQKRLRKDMTISRARAVAAASGGGQDLDLLGDLEEEGEYNTLMALWQGEEAARGRKAQAASSRLEGRMAKRAGYMKAGSTILSGGASIAGKY